MIPFFPAVPPTSIPPELIADRHRLNSWWTGQSIARVSPTRRHLATRVRRRLDTDKAPVVAVRGPSQVGKTTIQLQLIADQLIDPILRIAYWFEENIAADRFNALDRQGCKAYLFLGEVQNLDNWSAQLKFLVDTVGVKVLVTASSALRIERGRDSLAGRIHTVEAGTLSLTEIGKFHRLDHPDPFLPDNGGASAAQGILARARRTRTQQLQISRPGLPALLGTRRIPHGPQPCRG